MEQTEKMKNYVYKILAAACALVLGGWSIANAVPVDTLTISDGYGDSVTLGVGGSPVLAGTASTTYFTTSVGMVNWEGSLGSWTVTADTGYLTGTAQKPQLGLTFAETSSSAGTLTIDWTAVGLGPATGVFAAGVGGTLGSGASLTYSTFYSTGNAIPAVYATGFSFVLCHPGRVQWCGQRGGWIAGSPFSLTQVITITDTKRGHVKRQRHFSFGARCGRHSHFAGGRHQRIGGVRRLQPASTGTRQRSR